MIHPCVLIWIWIGAEIEILIVPLSSYLSPPPYTPHENAPVIYEAAFLLGPDPPPIQSCKWEGAGARVTPSHDASR